MNKITKRIVASLSAAAMIVSTFGSNSFSGTMMDSVYAEESATTSNRKGRSTGFDNLEQDIDGEYYNTGYGLHTNKTASEATDVGDGRTFDVKLESWYVGENPVDIATILDASGSMAWTVDTLEPLKIDIEEAEIAEWLNEKDITPTGDITKDLIALQEANDKYLPEEVVEKILKPENTDNTKLSYSGYKYYVYENRSSVSEFVPLGFWDGTGVTPVEDDSLVGYYPFDNSLENKAPSGSSAKMINHVDDAGKVDKEVTPTAGPAYTIDKSKGLNLQEAAKNCAILLDATPVTGKFTVEFDVVVAENEWEKDNFDSFDETPILYIGGKDGTGKDVYYRIVRGSRRPNTTGGSKGASQKIRLYDTTTVQPSTNSENKADNDDKSILDPVCFPKNVYNCHCKLEFDGKGKVTYTMGDATNQEKTLTNVIASDVQLILAGNVCTDKTNYSEVYVKNVVITEEDTVIGNYALTTDLSNSITSAEGASPKCIEQATGGGGEQAGTFNTESTVTGAKARPVYSSDSYVGGHSLNVTETSKNAAVLLDAKPTGSSYTISFSIKKDKAEQDDHNKDNGVAQIMYIGNVASENNYYHITRNDHSINDDRNLRFYDIGKTGTSAAVSASKVFLNDDNWFNVTYVINGNKVTVYKNGTIAEGPKNLDSTVNPNMIDIIIAGLKEEYKGQDILIDELYIFDKALGREEVNAYFCICGDNLTHATSIIDGEVVNIAQISNATNRLAQNPNMDERRGWYYVNSHSTWTDIAGCLESGKQYIGIKQEKEKDSTQGEECYNHSSEATIPSAWYSKDATGETPNTGYEELYASIKSGDGKDDKYYVAPEKERSIRFFVDKVGHLRCFVWTGSNSKTNDPRTFCSVVYCNGNGGNDSGERSSVTKYEQLNAALNAFFEKLAENSDLTNTSVVRFSTINTVEDDEDRTNENLKKLIIKDWTNWSDFYQETKENVGEPKESEYLKDLLIPVSGETSVGIDDSANKSGEYPYVMTGGTYTWTGLKAFYENMIVGTEADEDLTNYNIKIDARDKYLIIFTDGRDNTQDCTWDADGNPVKDTGSNYKDKKYVNDYKPVGSSISCDGELAKAWADKIKESGYTVFCVMMATGSVSPTANEEEYNKAYCFLNMLAGSNEENKEALDEAINKFITAYNDKKEDVNGELPETTRETWYDDGAEVDEKGWGTDIYELYNEAKNLQDYMNDHVLIAKPGTTNTTEEAFRSILAQIQQPRTDYTVQDYIDPRFNLIDKSGVLYKLGPNGNITYGSTTTKVGDIIDDPKAYGLPFTTREAENVNVESVATDEDGKRTYVNPDTNGTGYIYYDDDKDMYYLRWTDQIIPMRNSSLDTDTASENPEYLDVWSATIRLKAKDDFIGGNDILTNGNEAGENLVFSEATIENMDAYPELYNFTVEKGLDGKYTEREKLQVLSGTDRKINAVDAGGVSQAVYGKGMDIPSSGFPRVTVNVRLLPLNSKNLNDVIYMGEVVSPTMMLADLENDYMTGSYYLEYLERYAYRIYGNDAGETPLIELLNQWLRIDEDDVEAKTFTIPYMYLPDPVYKADGTLDTETSGSKTIAKVENSSGLDSANAGTVDAFNDLNLRDVTGFITYTWKRDDGSKEEQQKMEEKSPSGEDQYDITKEYVVKNTNQIVYNLQLKFTPLKTENLAGFVLDENFIDDNEKFFEVKESEFNDGSDVTKWTFTNRFEYLKAMVSETHIYEPHIIYDSSSNKWVLVGTGTDAIEGAIKTYVNADLDHQTEEISGTNNVKDKGVYDWDIGYKPIVGNEQLEYDKWKTDPGYYGNAKIESFEKDGTIVENCTLSANTIYVKDVVNGALALELVVDGKYLGEGSKIDKNKEYTFIATRYYDDPYDPLPYGVGGVKKSMDADTGEMDSEDKVKGKNYRLKFKVKEDTLPENPKDNEFYTVWAELESVEVKDSEATAPDGYVSITETGYTAPDALPIGTYEIHVDDTDMEEEQYLIGVDGTVDKHFTYLKIDNAPASFTYNRFPESVYTVSGTAKVSTDDGEYLIWDDPTDNASKNIAKNDRVRIKDSTSSDSQTLTFYFGTVKEREINGKPLSNTIGYSRTDKSAEAEGNDYAKDRLGIILLSADLNNLFISKEVTHTNNSVDKARSWEFIVTFTPNNDTESQSEFEENNNDGFELKWYKRKNSDSTWEEKTDLTTGYPDSSGGTTEEYPKTIEFDGPDKDGKYTTTIYLKHNEKVLIDNLPDGTWQVTETDVRDQILYSAHNDMDKVDEYSWSNKTDEWASLPGTGVEFTNQFPHYVFSAGGLGTYLFILCGGLLLLMASVLYYLSRLRKSKSRDKPDG